MNNLQKLCRIRGLTIPALANKTRFTLRSLERMATNKYPVHEASRAPEAWRLLEGRVQKALGTTLSLSQLLEQ